MRFPKFLSKRVIFLTLVTLIAISGLTLVIYGTWASSYDLKQVGEIPDRSVIYDTTNKFYSRLYGQDRIVVSRSAIPQNFVRALLAREDTRFYQHHGIDFYGILRAIVRNITHLSFKEGASTLTQQLARNSYALGGHNLHRKLLEAMVALRIEKHFSKEEILEAYANRIYYGAGVYGIETASELYFDKPCSELNLSESALLVGLIRAPSRFSPSINLKGALDQRDTVLDRMVYLKMITKAEAAKAKAKKITVVENKSLSVQENYAMDAVQRLLALVVSPEQMDKGGLKIYTTLDGDLQKSATEALEKHLAAVEKQINFTHTRRDKLSSTNANLSAKMDYLQGALVAIDNRTGGICAIVGGRDYRQSKFNRALQARRQIGSSFKPFVYTAAFENGLRPDSPIDDSPLEAGELRNGAASWSPSNSDRNNVGIQRAEYGLIHSRNTMSVRVGQTVGLDRVRDIAGLVGLCYDIPKVPSIYLGGFEASPKDLTTAYTIFPNHGVLKQSILIKKIVDSDGAVLFEATPSEKATFSRDAVDETSSILEEVMESGTASQSKALGLTKRAAGKTGTTNGFKDAWFVGYTSSLTCGVWVGFDQPQTIMPAGYGSALALPIWVDFMNSAPEARYPDDSLGGIGHDAIRDVGNTFDKIGRSFQRFFGGGKD